MTARPPLPGMPLTPEHARQFDKLLTTLSTEEALWISGYLAGFARHSPQPPLTEAMPAAPPLIVLYGSETGHAEGLAKRAVELAQAGGLTARAIDMADFRPPEIREVRHLMVLTSTHGEGDPPLTAADFCEFIRGRKAPKLEGMKFSVLGLGDSSYEHFCQTAKDIDRRLEELGAERVHPRADCDVDYQHPAAAWIDGALAAFAREQNVEAAAAPTTPVASTRQEPEIRQYDQIRPFPAPVIERFILNGRGSEKRTLHVELSVTGSGLDWKPGDSLGVVAENDPSLVAELLTLLDLDADDLVPADSGELPLSLALTRHYEITTLTPGFIEAWNELAAAARLHALNAPGQEGERRSYMSGRQIIDVVSEFPIRGMAGRDFVALLRPQQPRLYSLASSLAAYPDEAHLTVAVVRYESLGRQRQGVASSYLAERRAIDDPVPVYVSANKNFRLPSDPATPIIMIGPGTGVAPFRAFMQEREATGATGRNWLFFGDQHLRTDFLYQTEWQRLLKDGRLTRMDVAFSRDQQEKIYVQHRLLEHRREIHAWLEDGACIYVCGDASRMAPDVHAALAEVLITEGRMSREHADEHLRQLQRDKRYQRDVY